LDLQQRATICFDFHGFVAEYMPTEKRKLLYHITIGFLGSFEVSWEDLILAVSLLKGTNLNNTFHGMSLKDRIVAFRL